MAKVKLPYNTNNRLAEFIQQKADITGQYLGDVEKDLSEFCGLTIDKNGISQSMKKIKAGKVDPSLPVALKIAEYFRVKVEDIFSITE